MAHGKIFLEMNSSILAPGKDHVENVFWQTREILFSPPLKNFVTLCGMNNINKDLPYPMILFQDSSFKHHSNNPNIFICGLLLHDECFSINRSSQFQMFSKQFSFY